MSFQVGPKVLIVNTADQVRLLFMSKFANGTTRLVEGDDDYQTTTAYDNLSTSPDTQSGAEGATFDPANTADGTAVAQADVLQIEGFVTLDRATATGAVGAKAVPGQLQVSSITFTESAIADSVGSDILVNLNFTSDNFEGEFASHISDYKKTLQIILPVKGTDTVTTLASRTVEQIKAFAEGGTEAWVTATSALGVVTITSKKATITFTATFGGDAIASGNVSAAFATATPGYAGRNTWEQLKGLRLETHFGAYVESAWSNQVPIKGALYSSYKVTKTVSRPDLLGHNGGINTIPVGTFEYIIYVNQSLTQFITDLTSWLNANVPNRTMYTSTTAAGVLGGDPSTTTAAVDASSPFTDPLV